MLISYLVPFLEEVASYGLDWGPVLVLFFMTVESSFIPFPSEIVLIPAGFMAARGEFYPGNSLWLAFFLVILCGIAGSLLGSYINYGLSRSFGRQFLHRWGKYFFLAPDKLDRAGELFCEYGEITTFVCRLIPVVRQLISIPAGISRMNFLRFSIFTFAGAGVWVLALTLLGRWFGTSTADLSYAEIVFEGKALLDKYLIPVILGGISSIFAYAWMHRIIGGKRQLKGT